MPSKLKLNLDHLSVESFDTSVGERRRGTVLGNQAATEWTACGQFTCYDSCQGSCDPCTNYERTCNGNTTCGVYPCRKY